LPQQFTINIPVFQNGDFFVFDVRLRHKINEEGKLTLTCNVRQAAQVVKEAAEKMVQTIEQQTHIAVFMGNAPTQV
jgi:uncharacterized protein YfdQ (DUF2303 family)